MAIPVGFSMELPSGYEAQIRPRSGLAAKHHITVTNSPGTVDANYRGEVKVILYNLGREPFSTQRGDRIAQMVICKLPEINLVEATELSETDRGSGGFGSSGKVNRHNVKQEGLLQNLKFESTFSYGENGVY